MRRRVRNGSPGRIASIARGWWTNARFYWYTTRKAPLAVMLLLVVIPATLVVGFNYLATSLASSKAYRQELTCLALNVYHEARGEPVAGQYAVAEVTMNRVASGRFPSTVCGAVYQKEWDYLRKRYVSAFSWTEFDRVPKPEGPQWKRAWRVADNVYSGRYTSRLKGALYYHAVYMRPSWSAEKRRIAAIGNHIFYR